MNPFDFTIVTPVLNGARHIGRCIESVARQGVRVQHIVLDGGSTDGTQGIIASRAHSVAYWHSRPDNGQSDAIQQGLAMAEGRIFNWLNADDCLADGALREVLRLMGEGAEVACGRCEHVDASGAVLALGRTRVCPTAEESIGRYAMAQPSHFYLTEKVRGTGGLDTRLQLAFDMELWARYLAAHGSANVRLTDTVLAHFLIHPSGKSSALAEAMARQRAGVLRAIIGQEEVPDALMAYLSTGEEIALRPLPRELDSPLLQSYLALWLLPRSYAEGRRQQCRELLRLCGRHLNARERLAWRIRLMLR